VNYNTQTLGKYISSQVVLIIKHQNLLSQMARGPFSLQGYSNSQGPLCKDASAGAHGHVSPGYGPYWVGFSPLLFTFFLFLFLPDLENS
jgi:hypothetical protein